MKMVDFADRKRRMGLVDEGIGQHANKTPAASEVVMGWLGEGLELGVGGFEAQAQSGEWVKGAGISGVELAARWARGVEAASRLLWGKGAAELMDAFRERWGMTAEEGAWFNRVHVVGGTMPTVYAWVCGKAVEWEEKVMGVAGNLRDEWRKWAMDAAGVMWGVTGVLMVGIELGQMKEGKWERTLAEEWWPGLYAWGKGMELGLVGTEEGEPMVEMWGRYVRNMARLVARGVE